MELDNELLFFVESRIAHQYWDNLFAGVCFENGNFSGVGQAVEFWRWEKAATAAKNVQIVTCDVFLLDGGS